MATTTDTIATTDPDRPSYIPEGDHVYDPGRDGFDLFYRQSIFQERIEELEEDMRDIEQKTNLSDTERMFAMQTAMNSWSAVTNLRTNMIKSVSDSLKTIARNVT